MAKDDDCIELVYRSIRRRHLTFGIDVVVVLVVGHLLESAIRPPPFSLPSTLGPRYVQYSNRILPNQSDSNARLEIEEVLGGNFCQSHACSQSFVFFVELPSKSKMFTDYNQCSGLSPLVLCRAAAFVAFFTVKLKRRPRHVRK